MIALRSEIALLDARIIDLLERVDTGEAGEVWQALRQEQRRLKLALAEKEISRAQHALAAMEDLITRGAGDYSAWDEITRTIEQRRRLVESERKRLVEMEQMITADRAMLLVGAVAGIIKAHVTNKQQLAAISQDISDLLNR